jgi:hypothetical protein
MRRTTRENVAQPPSAVIPVSVSEPAILKGYSETHHESTT